MFSQAYDKECVLFDVDGTLVASQDDEIPFFFKAIEEITQETFSRNMADYPERSFASVITTASYPDKTDLYRQLEEQMLQYCRQKSWKSCHEAFSLLTALQKQNAEYFLVTGNFRQVTMHKLSKAGIVVPGNRLLATTVDMPSKKAIFEMLLTKQSIAAEHSVSLGDSKYDELTAKQLNIPYISVC